MGINWVPIKTGFTTPTFIKELFEVVINCPHEDQAMDIAIFMVDEIQKNAKSREALSMRSHNYVAALTSGPVAPVPNTLFGKASLVNAMTIWARQVQPGGVWDHKPIIRLKFPTKGNSVKHHHKYKEFEYYYDIWSNIHYGYIGAYCGFSESVLLDGAGLAQMLDDWWKDREVTSRIETNGEGFRQFDDYTDHLSISFGIQLFRDYPNPEDLTPLILMEAITKVDYPIQKNSKILHNCANVYQ
ncbi:hypothetical protein NBRC116591_33090 [Sessilibacter corallicola]|uniref:Bacterial toxin 44 domain-containing protein n=2 Tax=Sessilibacter corallicola TaxID=2904075 RepID=A0ABQ0ACW3_9GAMM